MIAQERFDFTHVPDEELYNPDRVFWQGKEAENAAWKAEMERRKEAKRLEQERVAKERAARLHTIKNAIAYSEPLAAEICGRISDGELLLSICKEENTPTVRRVNEWLKDHSDFKVLYDDAIKDRLTIFEEQIIEISDDMQNDFKTIVKNGKERRVVDPEVIARAKLRVDSRHKYLKAYKPERWGEQSTLNVKQDDSSDAANMSLSDLEAKIAELEHKDRVVNEDRRSVAA
jgi:hypothetical protein